jgi:putative ABC transport system ATP-binding protein
VSLVEVHNLTKIYEKEGVEVHALRGVDLNIEEGEYAAIMGPSGSGKSTLMHILGCLDRPTSGTYILDGDDVSRLPDNQLSNIRNKRVGFVFQSYNLIAQLNVIENVEIPLFYMGWPRYRRHQRSLELVEMVGLSDRLYHRPSELSGGQLQRAAIARALVNDPRLILADEPTGNLDTKTGKEILQIFDKLHQMGRTIMVVTHDAGIASMSNRTIHLVDGRIVEDKVSEKVSV